VAPPADRWSGVDPGADAVVALTADDLAEAGRRGVPAVAFHELVAPRPALSTVDVYLPAYRGKRLALLLGWLVAARLHRDGVTVAWHLDKRQGPDSLRKLLAENGWRLESGREGRGVVLTGEPAGPVAAPEPEAFPADVGDRRLEFAADFGVFSPGHVDEGTRLLLDVALQGPAAPVVADVGIGYGPLAIGIVANGVAERAVGTDIDALALWLARRNADTNGVPLDVACSADPAAVPPTPLTVCNVPTHIDATRSAALMAGLLDRARAGRLLAVVHASLAERYAHYFADAGLSPHRHPGPQHVVFDARG
jgi:16S rRNA G1207 methylase RsmC